MRRRTLISVAASLALVIVAPAAAIGDGVESSIARLRRLVRHPAVTPTPPARVEIVPFGAQIRRAAIDQGLDPALLAGLVRVESNFDPRAISSAGARGLGQLMPATARDLGVRDPFDPEENLRGAATYLADQIRTFGSVRLALAAYHAGPARVRARRVPAVSWRYAQRVERAASRYRRQTLP